MPIYEYQCESCGQRTEALQRVSDPPLEACDECGGGLRRLISAPSFQFKGSGWYVTDYARKGEGGKAKEKEPAKDQPADKGKDSGDAGSAAPSPADAGAGFTKAERIASKTDG